MLYKMKVVLLCHYFNSESKEMMGDVHYFRELSPWIQEILNMFKNKHDVELHVVAPNYSANRDVNVEKDAIHYHFYKYSPPLFAHIIKPFSSRVFKHDEPYKIAERFANIVTSYRYPMHRIPRIINEIKPDLIHLHGSENPDYGVGVIPLLDQYPVFLTVQGFAYLFGKDSTNILVKKNWDLRIKYERIINSSVKYLASIGLENNAFAPFENGQKRYEICEITNQPDIDARTIEKKYDIVFYSRVDKDKGIEDLIKCIGLLKQRRENLSAIVIGKVTPKYKERLIALMKDFSVDSQIDFAGFLEDHNDVYKLAASAKLLALPTLDDCQPNSIREAMFMRLPVISTKVGGIPNLNKHKRCVHLVDKGDIIALADGIQQILKDDKYAEDLINNSYSEMMDYFAPGKIYKQMIDAYMDIYMQERKKS